MELELHATMLCNAIGGEVQVVEEECISRLEPEHRLPV